MNTELMNNDVVEVVEDLTPRSSGGSIKGIGIGLAIAGLTYGGIKLVKKIRNKRKDILIYPKPKEVEETEGTDVTEVENDKKLKQKK